jgi:hypothetical protein
MTSGEIQALCEANQEAKTTPKNETSHSDMSYDKGEIEELVARYASAWNDRNAAKLRKIYYIGLDDDQDLEAQQDFFNSVDSLSVSIKDIDIKDNGRSVDFTRIATFVHTDPNKGPKTFNSPIRLTFGLVRIDGQLKLVRQPKDKPPG